MAQRYIDLGSGTNTGDGTELRSGGDDINKNFAELYKRAVAWTIGTYDAITCVIVDNKLYVLSDTVTLPFSSTDFANELATGEWVSAGSNYDDSWIQPAIDLKVQFKGQWVNASYNKNDWVISGSWMGVAKVDTASPFPPEPSGTPFWLLPATPTWEDLTLVGDIYQGLEFYGVQFNIVDGFRIWSNGVASETFRLFAYEVSGTGATTFLDFIDVGSNLPAGWNVVSLDQFGVLIPNQKYRLILETHADTNTTTLSDNWDWTPAEESPTAGNIGQTVTGLHINQVSGNATDQGAFLDNLVIGDDILLSESGDATRYNSYRIIGLNAKVGNVYNYEVTITASGDLLRDGRALDVDFTHKGVAVSTNYNRIVDAWPIPDTLPDQIQGFVTQDPDVSTSPTPGLNNNAYGLDLFYETYVLSDDWFYIGIGEGSTNQGGGADIQIVDNLTTQDATVALSGNMGYVLDNKKLNTVWPGQNVLVDKTNPLEPIISSIPNTTAGYLTRAYFTGETELTTETTFYKTNLGDKGTVASINQTVVNGDNVTQFFAVDFLGDATTIESTLITGDYAGYLQVQADSPDGNEIYSVEIYLTDDQGVPFDSGIVGQPIGGLGFQVLSTGTTGLIKLADSTPTIVTYPFSISESLLIPIGTRIRYHISATNVGTGIGDVTMHLFSGSDWLTYLDTPTVTDTTHVVNNDHLINGNNQAEVNTNVEANKIGLEGGEDYRMTGAIVGGEVTEDTVTDGRERITTKQMAGFLTYQGIENPIGSGDFYYSEGLGDGAILTNEGLDCVGIGNTSLSQNKGNYVTAIGKGSGSRQTGDFCAFVGSGAGYLNTGDGVTGVGYDSVRNNSGENNIGVGRLALAYATGNDNVAVGYEASSANPMPYTDTASLGSFANPTQSNQIMLGRYSTTSVRVGNQNYKATNQSDLVPLSQVAVSSVANEPTGATKADNQVVISDTDYGDGSSAVAGTLYFIKP